MHVRRQVCHLQYLQFKIDLPNCFYSSVASENKLITTEQGKTLKYACDPRVMKGKRAVSLDNYSDEPAVVGRRPGDEPLPSYSKP
ncbi:hypothetical protein EJB05_01419 [Eragrostis curvula]|uniref:Uncharacterized protein n=1 Tax=Eragrostis curvula TaxID=38414 RepID=A0A5J9WRX9_9POAL|nr:hypothetical protein EJB05_01419 [Eragrostis curvula]